MNNAINKIFNDKIPKRVFSYDEFMSYSINKVENTDINILNEKELNYYNFSKLNLHRINRINKTFKVNEELLNKINSITNNQTWIVITEDWCGDSAQNLPYIYNYVKLNPKITMQIILRDENLEAIDEYFKEGNPRSIPKIVAFNENNEELFVWGPRPKFAQDLVQQLKAEGYTNEQFNKELHLWYSKNRGVELTREFISLIKNI